MSAQASGTRYSNATKGDLATQRVVHGFQVYEQEGTGRESFVDPRNNSLCGVELAECFRAEIIRDSAPDLLAALEGVISAYHGDGTVPERKMSLYRAQALVDKARGLRDE